MIEWIEKVQSLHKMSLIQVEHQMTVVQAIADRILVLDQGTIVAEGDWATIQQSSIVQDIYFGTA